MGAIRPGSLVGFRKAGHKPYSSAEKRRTAMISPQWQLMRQQILDAYKMNGSGWAGFAPREKASICAIARTLFRKGLVDAFGGDQPIAWALEQLAGEGKISLPPKKIKKPPRMKRTG